MRVASLLWRLIAGLCGLLGRIWGILCSSCLRGSTLLNDKEHRHVLISGCDSGFGRAAALLMDSHGIPVFAGCITEKGAQYLRQNGSQRLVTIQLDVTSDDDVTRVISFVESSLSGSSCLWGLVNNAGVSGIVGLPLESLSVEDYTTALNVNLLGVIRLTMAALPLLTLSRGRVVNVCCASARLPLPGHPSYLISKQALAAWSEALRREKSCTGLHVATIYPGAFQTNMNDLDTTWRIMKQTWTRRKELLENSYGDSYTEHAMKAIKRSRDRMSCDLTEAAQVYLLALFSVRPKTAYNIGADSWTMLFVSLLPTSIQDRVIATVFRNPSRHRHLMNEDLHKHEQLMHKLSQN